MTDFSIVANGAKVSPRAATGPGDMPWEGGPGAAEATVMKCLAWPRPALDKVDLDRNGRRPWP